MPMRNFFTKYFVIIFLSFLSLLLLLVFYLGSDNVKKEKPELLSPEKAEVEKEEEKEPKSENKNPESEPKIKIENEKSAAEKAEKKNQLAEFQRQHEARMNEYQQKFDDYNKQLQSLDLEITSLKQPLILIEQSLTNKKKEHAEKRAELQLKLFSPDDNIRLKAELKQLGAEVIEIMNQSSKAKHEIELLKIQHKSLSEKLQLDRELKDRLEQEHNKLDSFLKK